MKYQGHTNKTHWNVALWIGNDEPLYRMAQSYIRIYRNNGGRKAAATAMLNDLHDNGITETPDGYRYSASAIRAAMVGM
jgi:hypothetical protein